MEKNKYYTEQEQALIEGALSMERKIHNNQLLLLLDYELNQLISALEKEVNKDAL